MKLLRDETTTNQRAAQSNASAGGKKFNPTKGLLTVSEYEFHQALGAKDQTILTLQQQNSALLTEVKRLSYLLYKENLIHSFAPKKAQQLDAESTE